MARDGTGTYNKLRKSRDKFDLSGYTLSELRSYLNRGGTVRHDTK